MNLPTQIAKHLREVHFGGNWTGVNIKDTLSDLNLEQATAKLPNFNTIAALVFHINYYAAAILKVFEGHELNAHDNFSFDLPPIQTQQDWENLRSKCLLEAEKLAGFIDAMDAKKIDENFTDEKYGSYYRNLHGLIEHCHYHLGQMVILKKLILKETTTTQSK